MAHLIRKLISTPKAPRPVAPYNQAVVWDRTVYVSGCLGLDKDTMKMVSGGIKQETRQALVNLGHVLEAADSGYDKVIKVTVLMKDIKDFGTINEIYKEFFKEHNPARTAYEVGNLPLNALVEIEVVAGTGELETMSSKL
ncbi:rutC family protein UK114 isoform X1 [Photinus pyralis]|uniref:Translation initiation inhibitor n=1 Tax=Photinus pyralis TaxID=7054 RepID=A0A1Y1JU25_PHOPY|nr:rutC family protein UK114 isoform X1 [Photinus pyralis]